MDWKNKCLKELKEYRGETLTFMEVCGSHTAAIAKSGIKEVISSNLKLVSGPGCPVCVTASSYIDRLIELAKQPNTTVVTFGDLLRVPGSVMSLNQAKGEGAKVKMVYSPMDTLKLAKENKEKQYVFAAVGFETTTPVYALMIEQMEREQIENVKILTALKTMPAAIEWLCSQEVKVDGFLAPGHVCAITGSNIFEPLAKKYEMPFAVGGFQPDELIYALYGLLNMAKNQDYTVKNFYMDVVTNEGNEVAIKKVQTYFEASDAIWRGMGSLKNSGMFLRDSYKKYDAGSKDLIEDQKINKACCCDQVLIGKMSSKECPLFKKVCHPQKPQGACMVSSEGSCYQEYVNS